MVDNDKDLPADFLKTWNFDIRDHLAKNKETNKQIKTNAVAFSGGMPQWLVAYLTMPLFNTREVWVYNRNPFKSFICVRGDSANFGSFVPYEILE
jgi:hypothetical protein